MVSDELRAESRSIAMGPVGFAGLGEMGGPMAGRLVAAGFQVVGFDPDPARAEIARLTGISLATSPREVAQRSRRVVISMVRDSTQTHSLLFGPEGMLSSGQHNGLIPIVMSTLDPDTLREMSARLNRYDIEVVDAPVSGARLGAEQGTLSIMAAGPSGALGFTRPLLDCLGRHIFLLGTEVGTGQAAKLANNLILAGVLVATAEGLRFALAHDLDDEKMLPILESSSGGSWVTTNWVYFENLWNQYRSGNALDAVYKDVEAALRQSRAQGERLPLTQAARGLLKDSWNSNDT